MMRRAFSLLLLLLVAGALTPFPTAAQAPAPLPAEKDYIIGPEDLLEIQV